MFMKRTNCKYLDKYSSLANVFTNIETVFMMCDLHVQLVPVYLYANNQTLSVFKPGKWMNSSISTD